MVRAQKSLFLWLGVWMIVIGISKQQIDRRFSWRYPALTTLVMTENYTSDLGALLLGSHRLAADIAYVQFLQYYGLREQDQEHYEGDGHDHYHFSEKGNYPRLLEFGRRIARLDPYFNSAVLEVAGSLAFNQIRIDQSLKLLQEAMTLDPAFYRYRLYVAAILYKNEGQDDKLIDVLAEAVRYPDSPYMLKNILANLYKKKGRFLESAQMRLLMIQTAPTVGDAELSKVKLLQLIKEHPEIGRRLTPP